MNAVGKTLGSTLVALVGLLAYLGVVVGAMYSLGTGAVLYLALLLTLVVFVAITIITVQPDDA